MWVEAHDENAVKVFRALAEFGAPLSGLTAADFAREGFFYQVGCHRFAWTFSCRSMASNSKMRG